MRKVFIYKALKTWLTDVLVHFLQINKESQLNICSFKWLVQIFTWPEQFISCLHLEKMMTASKHQNEMLVKYVNIKIWQRFLVHIIFRVYSITVCICIYSVLLCCHRASKHVMVTIVTSGITVNIGVFNQWHSKSVLGPYAKKLYGPPQIIWVPTRLTCWFFWRK